MTRPDDPRELLEILNPEDLPRLAEFLAGYLHEDWNLDYDSPAEAAYDFLVQADANDAQELAIEWSAFARAARVLPLDELNRILAGTFRCGWSVVTIDEIDGVSQELESALRE